jgi:DNA-binding GntR family transcriptional regulator
MKMTAPARNPPRLDRYRHAAPQVLEFLRNQIIALELPPGIALARSELASQFGVSQTPVRDALIRLEEEGLIEVFAQHKTVVSRIDIHSAQQAHFLRCSVELEIVRTLSTQSSAALVKTLRGTIAQQKISLEAGNYPDFVANDQSFHRQMYEAAGVPDVYTIVRAQSGHIDRLRRLHVPEPGKGLAIITDHKRIVDAIAHGKPDDAARRLREHLSGTLSWVDAVRTKYPNYITN